MTTRVIIAGSRHYAPAVADRLVAAAMQDVPTPTVVLSGTATGIDQAGERWATAHGIPVERYPADWSMGRKAGPLRNRHMASLADALVLVWDGASPGSRSMLREAEARGLSITQHLSKESGHV